MWCSRDTTQEQLQAGLLAHMRLPLASETKMYKRVLEYEKNEAQRKAQRVAATAAKKAAAGKKK